MLRTVEYLVLTCDACAQQLQDDDRGVELFESVQEVVQHLGGTYEGRIYPAPTVAGEEFGAFLADGTYYCSTCKLEPHDFIPGQLLAQSCARCGRLDTSHDRADLPPADAVDQETLFSDVPLRPSVRPDDVDPCREMCGTGWMFAGDDLPEPKDGARIEFSYNTDLYGAHNDVASSVQANWPANVSWCLYGGTVPHTWECMIRTFGPAMRRAVRLYPATAEGRTRG